LIILDLLPNGRRPFPGPISPSWEALVNGVLAGLGGSGDGGIFEGAPCGSGYNDDVLEIACNPCIGDCEATPDGIVGMEDFLALLAQWGTIDTCDFDGDGVGITDLLRLVADWGPCP
jgi:hypothetical protein